MPAAMSAGLTPLRAKSPQPASRSWTTCKRVRPMPKIDACEADVLDAFERGALDSVATKTELEKFETSSSGRPHASRSSSSLTRARSGRRGVIDKTRTARVASPRTPLFGNGLDPEFGLGGHVRERGAEATSSPSRRARCAGIPREGPP